MVMTYDLSVMHNYEDMHLMIMNVLLLLMLLLKQDRVVIHVVKEKRTEVETNKINIRLLLARTYGYGRPLLNHACMIIILHFGDLLGSAQIH
ncbi:hypothetical protein QVD17_36503 [Tagetes erecta]|uniref:Uncharacterized protein n=1 Tax=Tagetes erecta TaxID=13708 RepID=A0AAD8JSV2_TARER|nr:hypothetical protein QVD17_36503 [Tagetes erecta]